MSEKSEWQNLSSEERLNLTKLSRALIRGSIIEDAATRFMAMCIAEAVAKQKAKSADEIEALRAENERLREALRNSRVAETMLIADHLRDKAKRAEEMPAGFTIECVPPRDVASILRSAADAIDRRARAALNERKENE